MIRKTEFVASAGSDSTTSGLYQLKCTKTFTPDLEDTYWVIGTMSANHGNIAGRVDTKLLIYDSFFIFLAEFYIGYIWPRAITEYISCFGLAQIDIPALGYDPGDITCDLYYASTPA